jgi:hypothetical protein
MKASIQQISFTRGVADDRWADILDVAERLADGDLHNATNAAAVMVRSSPLYRKTLDAIMEERRAAAGDPE